MQIGRRIFLKGSVAMAVLTALPRAIFAAAWPEKAFAADTGSAAIQELFGGEQPTPSAAISLTAPEIAENGAVVPISVETTLQGVSSVSIVVDNNPRPLAVSFDIPPGTLPNVACRIKMGKTSPVTAILRTDSGLFSASKEVKVTIGGCGG
jgi:sulfur-oxidizing protein SoxY